MIKSNNLTQRSKTDGIYDAMTSVEFFFILYLMIKMLGITNDLCQALHYKSQDILNVMQLRDKLTIEHHNRFDIFITSIDSLLTKMNSRFNDKVVELLVLSSALDPVDNYKAFWEEDIYRPMNDFYPRDFTEQEKLHMKIQLKHFQLDAYQSTKKLL
ncbi:hypothetical protein PVK06_016949 [Gossypium arboreum]|uniref:Uncharacterized protein n=1 Tax=Gossypium arboreum TaxID=29729 RepID=A0ABR0Q273_GOSAR|nr:hypothetical protein PVK06_016949 [Gossypium arboreum]